MRTPVRIAVPESFISPASPFRRGEAGSQPALSLSFPTTRGRNVRRRGAPGYVMLVSCSGQLAGSSVFVWGASRTTQVWFEPLAHVPNPPASHNTLPAAFALSPGNSCITTRGIDTKPQDRGLGESLSLGAIRHSDFVARRRRPLLHI